MTVPEVWGNQGSKCNGEQDSHKRYCCPKGKQSNQTWSAVAFTVALYVGLAVTVTMIAIVTVTVLSFMILAMLGMVSFSSMGLIAMGAIPMILDR